MSIFFNRIWELSVNDQVFIKETTGLQFRIKFEILIDYGGSNSYADISLYNLRKDTVGAIFKRGNSIALRAGYEDAIDSIFKGEIRNVFKERVGADVITRIIARGGSKGTASINQPKGKGVRITTLIRACAKAWGYSVVMKDSDFNSIAPYGRGYALDGDPRVILDKLAQAHGFNYVIENERIVVTPGSICRGGSPYIVSQQTGMEGIPEITEIGCDVAVRLTPKIRIGGEIDVQTELSTFNFSNLYFQDVPEQAGKGVYCVQKLRYTGDSWGDAWSVQVTAIR